MILVTKAYKQNYVTDLPFMLIKFKTIVTIISMSYFMSFLSSGDITRNTPYLSAPNEPGVLDKLYVQVPFLSQLIATLSSIWFCAAIALLPFTHTVIDYRTGQIVTNESKQLLFLHKIVYVYPYKVFSALFAIHLCLFVLKLILKQIQTGQSDMQLHIDGDNDSDGDDSKILTSTNNPSIANVKGGFGFSFTSAPQSSSFADN